MFANSVECFNRRLKTEKRDLVLTNRALYFVSRKKKGGTVLYKVTKVGEGAALCVVGPLRVLLLRERADALSYITHSLAHTRTHSPGTTTPHVRSVPSWAR